MKLYRKRIKKYYESHNSIIVELNKNKEWTPEMVRIASTIEVQKVDTIMAVMTAFIIPFLLELYNAGKESELVILIYIIGYIILLWQKEIHMIRIDIIEHYY